MLKVAPWRGLVSGLAIVGLAGFFYVVPVRQMLAVADDPEVGKDGFDLGNFLDAGFEVKTSFTRADGRLFVVLQKDKITEWCDTSFAKEGAVISKTCVEPAGRYHPSDRPDPLAGMDLSQAPKPERGGTFGSEFARVGLLLYLPIKRTNDMRGLLLACLLLSVPASAKIDGYPRTAPEGCGPGIQKAVLITPSDDAKPPTPCLHQLWL